MLKRNPLLTVVNPLPQEIDRLYVEAKRLMPSLERNEFEEGVEQFVRQHGCLPRKMSLCELDGFAGNVLIEVGKSDQIRYSSRGNSRKAPHDYYHDTKGCLLVTDSTGRFLGYLGDVRVANSGKNAGWLVD